MDGGRRRLRRGGYLTWEAAAAARDRLSVPVLGDPRDGVHTVVEWLEAWVESRARLRDSTRRMYQGLRRGEACGLVWDDRDLDEGIAYISRQLQQGADGQLKACPLKTESSRRAVALDPETIIVLRAHRSRQDLLGAENLIHVMRPGDIR
jgi:integrase